MSRFRSFATPEEAQAAFYTAFTNKNIDAMMAVFSDEEEILCIHPNGRRITGHSAIRDSWQDIFRGNNALQVKVDALTRWSGGFLAVIESFVDIAVSSQSATTHQLLSCNVFQRGAAGWRLVCHHSTFAAGKVQQPAEEDIPRTLH